MPLKGRGKPTARSFADSLGLHSLRELRELPAQQMLERACQAGARRDLAFASMAISSREAPKAIYAAGKQGARPRFLPGGIRRSRERERSLGREQPDACQLQGRLSERLYKEHAAEVLKVYAPRFR